MTSLQRRGSRTTEPASALGRIDRLFDEWLRTFPMRRPFETAFDMRGEDLIRVDEYREGDTQVIRAELPDIDPDRDVELTIRDGMLRIHAERRTEEESEEKGYTRRELRYGTMTRTLPLPDGASEDDVKASYEDGILEIRVPIAEPTESEPKRISVSRA